MAELYSVEQDHIAIRLVAEFHFTVPMNRKSGQRYEAFRVFLSSKYSGESVLNIVFFRKIREKATALFSWK